MPDRHGFPANRSTKATVKPGEVVLSADPFAHVLKSELQGTRCDWCYSLPADSSRVMRCAGCRWVHYCGNTCQIAAWKHDHKWECTNLKRVTPKTPPDFVRLMAKILVRLQKGGDTEEGKISKTRRRIFKDLMSHYSELKEDPRRLDHFSTVRHVLQDFLGPDFPFPNPSELLGIYGRISVNCFNVVDGEFLVIGCGVYLAATIFDHSCDPNAVATFEGNRLTIRATKEIPSFDFGKVFISYIDQLQSTADRRLELQTGYYFKCQCPCCTDSHRDGEMCSLRCPSCGHPVPIPFLLEEKLGQKIADPEICAACRREIPVDMISDFMDVQTFSRDQLKLMKYTNYLDVCRGVIRRQEPSFHSLNIWRIRTLDAAFDAAINLELWEEALDYGRLSLEGYEHYLGNHSPMLGLQLLRLGKLELFLGRDSDAQTHLTSAAKIIANSHGPSHTFFVHQVVPLMQQLRCR